MTNFVLQPDFTRSMALLKLEGKDGPVYFVMEHPRYHAPGIEPDPAAANQEHQRYFFEEHSCPTNWLRECVAVIKGGNDDPHGFLEFVRAVDVPENFDVNGTDRTDGGNHWNILFPEAFMP